MNRNAIVPAVWLFAASLIAQDQQPALPSKPEEITSLLEKRWPLRDIDTHCTPARRWNPANQNLVMDGERVWRGKLYDGKAIPFDEISWYANVNRDGIVYSLNAIRGKDFWNLEIGSEKTLRQPRRKSVLP